MVSGFVDRAANNAAGFVLTLLLLEYGFGELEKDELAALVKVLTLLLLEYGFGADRISKI